MDVLDRRTLFRSVFSAVAATAAVAVLGAGAADALPLDAQGVVRPDAPIAKAQVVVVGPRRRRRRRWVCWWRGRRRVCGWRWF